MRKHTYKRSKFARVHMDDDEGEDDGKGGFPQLMEIKRKPYKQFEEAFAVRHTHFYLCEEIGAPSDYVDMVYRMMKATEDDTIFIHLNTPGGQLDTGIQIINAIQNTQAHVITVIESAAYSMGSLIFLAGDEMVINDNCMMMIHNFNGGFIGKGNEIASELDATLKWYDTITSNLYIPFLTPEELARVTRGEDMWLQSTEIRERLERMVANGELDAVGDPETTVKPTLTPVEVVKVEKPVKVKVKVSAKKSE